MEDQLNCRRYPERAAMIEELRLGQQEGMKTSYDLDSIPEDNSGGHHFFS
jgi:hypothetical protein